MLKHLRIFFTGIAIAFVGMLPLGTQNLAAMQIAISDGLQPALLFALGMVVPDVMYVYVTLLSMQWIQKQKKLFKALEWITLIIVVSLALANFYAALHPSVEKNVLLSNALPKFLLGVVINGVNPMQIPFWFGWSTILFTKKVLEPRWRHYHIYAAGVAIGMFGGTAVFIFGGRLIAEGISNNQNLLYILVGLVFTITALLQVWKMRRKKTALHKLEHPEKITDSFAPEENKFTNQTK
ncbi:MAG: lysine transporter LysE [Chitinophagaceae bacterium]|nr:MAG: lysine transporter LysE [Chitinophagaceae bacterium]